MQFIVYLFGGIWKLKDHICRIKPGPIRSLLLNLYYLYLKQQGGYIGHSAIFSGPPCFPHGLKGVFIAGGAEVGKNCIIFQNVTIGVNSIPTSSSCGIPRIGDHVYIGAGAAIIGNIHIGHSCRIGANCTVFQDVPDNCTVVSPPPRIIQSDNLNNVYYKWSNEGPVYYDNGEWHLETNALIIELLNGKL